jgi:hypothetical protein
MLRCFPTLPFSVLQGNKITTHPFSRDSTLVKVLLEVTKLIVVFDFAKLGVDAPFNLAIHDIQAHFYVMLAILLDEQ